MSQKEKKNEIAKSNNNPLTVTSEIDEMFGGPGIQIPVDAPLPQISIMRESAQFEMPDGSYAKEFTGHIIHWHNANQYYSSPYGEGQSLVPDCSSSNGREPDGGEFMQKGACRECELNQFGSAKEGSGKACQNTLRMYILIDGEVLPSVLKAPPFSLAKKDSLMRWLTSAANTASKKEETTSYQAIRVKFSLRKKEFNSGMNASVIQVETLKVLNIQEDSEKLKQLGRLYKEFMDSYIQRVSQDVSRESV